MNVLSGISSDKPIMIEFGCGLTPLSFDRKLILQVDTDADANAINKKTFDQLFPEVELEESTFILKNFDERLIKPIGSFRCFLRWKGHKYRVQIVARLKRHTWCKFTRGFIPRKIHGIHIQAGGH